jgi:hypothetical protein
LLTIGIAAFLNGLLMETGTGFPVDGQIDYDVIVGGHEAVPLPPLSPPALLFHVANGGPFMHHREAVQPLIHQGTGINPSRVAVFREGLITVHGNETEDNKGGLRLSLYRPPKRAGE